MSRISSQVLPRWVRTNVMLLVVGAALGAAGYYTGKTAARMFPNGPGMADLGLRWSDGLAGLVALVMVGAAAAVLVTSLNRHGLGQMLKLEGAANDEEVGAARAQAIVMAFSGVIMMLPVAFAVMGLAPTAALAIVIGLLAVHTFMNLRVYQRADELLRRITMESAAITFWLGQGALFLWAAAERLGVAPVVTSWDLYVCVMAAYLVVACIVTGRRGLA